MSKEIDYEVVSMEFDNKDFEKHTKESMSTLEKLKAALNFDGVKDGFDRITKSAKATNLSPVAKGLAGITDGISMADVAAARFFMNLVDDAYRAGKQLVKSLSIDQITAGWDKYTLKNENVQVIMNATGLSVDQVNDKLYTLMRVSDETSYSFGEMTSALSTMLAKGADIDEAIPMIVGIAEATAYAGKTGFEFQRTISNLVQSYSSGFLNLQDWKSVQLAGTNSKKLVETLIKAGEELGTIRTKGSVTIENFNETLKDKWATPEVMEKAFGGWSSLILDAINAADNGSYETVTEAIAELASGYDDYVVKATEASQASKSFKEAIDATKDAVSTGWMTTFEILIGDYEKAKKLWTDFGNFLYEMFAEGAEARNAWLKEITTLTVAEVEIEPRLPRNYKRVEDFVPIGDIDTRAIFIEGLFNALYALKDVIDTVKGAFKEIFPAPTALQVYRFAESFTAFTEKLRLSEDTAEKFKNIFKGIFSVFDIFAKLLATIGRGAIDFVSWLFPGIKGVFEFSSGLGIWLTRLDNAIEKSGLFTVALNGIKVALKPIGDAIRFVTRKIVDFASAIFGIDFTNFSEWASNAEIDLQPLNDFFANIGSGIKDFFSKFGQIIPFLKTVKQSISDAISSVIEWFKKGFEGVKIDTGDVVHNGLLGGIVYVLYQMLQTVKEIKSSNIGNSIRQLLGSISSYFGELQKNVKAERIKPIATAMLEIAAAMLLLSFIPENKVLQAIAVVAVIGQVMSTLIEKMNASSSKATFSFNFSTTLFGVATMLKSIGVAMLLIAAAALIIAQIPEDRIVDAMGSVAGIVAILGLIAAVLAGIAKERHIKTSSDANYDSTNGKIAGIGFALIGLGLALLIVAFAAKLLNSIGEPTEVETAVKNIKGIIIALGIAASAILLINGMHMPSKSASFARDIDGTTMLTKNNDKTIAGPVLAIAAAILIIAYAAKLIAEANTDNAVWKAVGVIAVVALLAAMMIALMTLINKVEDSSDKFDSSRAKSLVGPLLAVFSVIVVMSLIVALLANIPQDGFNEALRVIALIAVIVVGTVVVFSTLAVLIAAMDNKFGGVFERFAKTMFIFSASIAVLGIALQVLAAGLATFAALGGAGKWIFDKLQVSFKGLLSSIAVSVKDAAPEIAEAFVVVSNATLIGWVKAINDIAPDLMEGLYDAAMRILALLSDEKGKELISTIIGIVIAILEGVAGRSSELADAIAKVIQPIAQILVSVFAIDIANLALLGFIVEMWAAFKMMSAMKKYAGDAIATAISIALVLGVIGGVVYLIQKEIDFEDSLKKVTMIVGVIAVMSLILAVIGTLKLNVGASFNAALSIITFIGTIFAAFGLVALGIGAAVEKFNWDLAGKINTGFEVLKSIARGLGAVIGEFVGGIVGGYTDGKLESMGGDVAGMGDKLAAFGASMDTVDSESTEKVKNIADAILALTEASVLDGIKSWLGIEGDFTTLASGLSDFGVKLIEFQNSIDGLDPEKLNPGLDAITKLAEASKAIPGTGGLLQMIMGETDLEGFGSGLWWLGHGMLMFQLATQGLKEDVVTNATTCGSAIVELCKEIPNSDGWLAKVFGDNTPDVFGSKLKAFGEGIRDFDSAATNVNTTTVLRATRAGEAIVALASKIPQTDDVWYKNHVDISDFGQLLKDYATAYKDTAAIFQEAEDAGAITLFTRANTVLSDMIDTAIRMAENQDKVGLFDAYFKGFLGSLQNIAYDMETLNGSGNIGGIIANSIINGITMKRPDMLAAATKLFATIGTASKNIKTDTIKKANELTNAIVNAIRDKRNRFYEAGVYVMEGFKLGFNNEIDNAIRTVGGGATAIVDEINRATGVSSPSWKTALTARYLVEGFLLGWQKNSPEIQNEVSGTALAAMEAVDSAVATVHDILEASGDLSPTIRPVVDTTYAAQGAAAISSMFGSTGMRFDFSEFNRNAKAIRALEDTRRTRVAVERKQPEVVGAINELRDRLDAIDSDIMNMQIVLDSGKTVGGIHKKLDKKLGTTVRDKKRGIR